MLNYNLSDSAIFPQCFSKKYYLAHVLYGSSWVYRSLRNDWCYIFLPIWCLNTTGYHAFIHFFRSSTWSLDKIAEYWNRFVLSQNETVKSSGRVVLQADNTYVPEDGRQNALCCHLASTFRETQPTALRTRGFILILRLTMKPGTKPRLPWDGR